MPYPRARSLVPSLALALATVACARNAPPPPAPPPAAAAAPQAPAAPPGHLLRPDVDRVLVSQGPPWILRRVMMEEVLRGDGKFTGWRVVGLPEEWKDIDVRPGDVVTRVNGLPLETPDEAWEAWKSVARLPALTLALTRDGTARQLVIPIDGAPVAETLNALGRDPGPRRAETPPESRGRTLGGGTLEVDQDAY
jgi:hypothetical protein